MDKFKTAFPELYAISAYGYIEAVKDWHKHLGTPETMHKIDLILAVFNYDREGYKLNADDYLGILVCFQAVGLLNQDCMNFVYSVYKYHNQPQSFKVTATEKSEPAEDKKKDEDDDKKLHQCKCGGHCKCHDFKPKKKIQRTPFGMFEFDNYEDFYKKLCDSIVNRPMKEDEEMRKIFDAFFGPSK